MYQKRSVLITALVLAVLLFQFAPIGGTESAAAASLCNAVTFISDVTIPDGSILNSGTGFVKTWRLKNSGTCTWTNAYSVVYDSGTQLGGTTSVPVPASVAPGQTVDITVNMSTPATPGHYRSNWKLMDASGVRFGLGTAADKPFWVDINVSSTPTPSPTIGPDATGVIFQGTVRRNGAGVPGVRIYYGDHYPGPGSGAIEYGYGTLIATTGADGTYKKFVPISGDYGGMTVWAELQGFGFEPVIHSWYHGAGLETKTLDFTAAPGNPGPFPGPSAAFDFNWYTGTWTSGAGALPYPGTEGDARGFVLRPKVTTFEDGSVDPDGSGWLVAPQNVYNGFIQGVFPEFTVHSGDRFRTSVGCAYGSSCYVTFRLSYRIGSGPISTLWSWVEKNEGQVYYLDKDISVLAGKKVNFILTVLATGSPIGDKAIWGHPRIVNIGGTIWTPTPTPLSTTVTPSPTPITPSPTTITPSPTPGIASPTTVTLSPTSGTPAPTTVTPSATVPPPPSLPGTLFDFASSLCSAYWTSGAGALTCPGTDGDARGFALPVSNPKLENGMFDNASGLILFPQNKYNGYVKGVYPEIAIQSGDRFQGIVNCAYGSSCYVTFRLSYQVGTGAEYIFWSWAEKNEGQYYRVDKDLSFLAGKKVKFILTILATGPATGDRALWSQPRIVRAGYVSSTLSPTPTPTSTNGPYSVTGATAIVSPLNSQAYCNGPNPVDVSGTITTNGPTTVTFHWEMGRVNGDIMNTTSDETLIFSNAGTLTVREGAYKVDCGNYSARLVITSPNNFDAITYYSISQAVGTPSPSPSPTPTATATPLQGSVTNLTASISVPAFVNCRNSMSVDLLGAITSSGPATVTYHWEVGTTTLTSSPEKTLIFTTASIMNADLPAYGVACGEYTARLVVTSPNPTSAQTNFTLTQPTLLPIYDFTTNKAIGTMACNDYPNYTWTPQTGNGESGGWMVSQTPLFGKSPAGFLRVDGNWICSLNLP